MLSGTLPPLILKSESPKPFRVRFLGLGVKAGKYQLVPQILITLTFQPWPESLERLPTAQTLNPLNPKP